MGRGRKRKRAKKSSAPMHKYWVQRFDLFSRFDEGVQMDDEAWFSVTPEAIAQHVAERLAACPAIQTVVDVGAGVGSYTIQLALQRNRFQRIVHLEIDEAKLAMARHNTALYGVADCIEFMHADFLGGGVVDRLRAQIGDDPASVALIMSPPWGGPGYSSARKQTAKRARPRQAQPEQFDVDRIRMAGPPANQEIPFSGVFQLARSLTDNVVLCLPRTSALPSVVALAAGDTPPVCEIERASYTAGKSARQNTKLLHCYFGGLVIAAGV